MMTKLTLFFQSFEKNSVYDRKTTEKGSKDNSRIFEWRTTSEEPFRFEARRA